MTTEEMTVERIMPTIENELSAEAQARKASTNKASPMPNAALVNLRLRLRSRSTPRAKIRMAATPENSRELNVTETF